MIAPQLPIHAFSDSKSLLEAANTSTLVTDNRLRVEIAAIREMKEKDGIAMDWISKQFQIADVLTKKGAPKDKLMAVFKKGQL